MQVSDLDKHKRSIEAADWMAICLPSRNPTTTAKWRRQAGLSTEDGPTKQHDLSQYHAMLLLVRSRLELICVALGEPRPKDAAIDCFLLEGIADRWIATLSVQGWNNTIGVLLGDSTISLKEFKGVLAQWGLGKSERSIRRYLALAGLSTSLRRTRRLNAMQVRSIAIANVG